VAAPLEPAHLIGQYRRVALLPAIADQQRHCAAMQHAPAPMAVEGAQTFTDARAAGPIDNLARCLIDRLIDIANLELAGDPRQARAEDEALDLWQRVRDAVQ